MTGPSTTSTTSSTEQEPPEGASTEPAPPPADSSATEPAKPEKFADVLAGLDDHARALVQAELTRKNNEAKNLRERVNAAEPKATKYDEAQAAQQSAEEQAAQRERAAQDRASAAEQRMVRSEVRALAADRFADPDDAAAFIDASQYLRDGEPDTDGIRSALDDLLTRKPHLAKQEKQTPRPPAPNPAQGSSSGGPATQTGPARAKELFEARHGRKAAAH